MDDRAVAAAVVLAVVLVAAGTYGFAVQHHRLTAYEETTGTVTHASVEHTPNDYDGRGVDLSDRDEYEANVTYEYSVDGETYDGRELYPGSLAVAEKTRGQLTPIATEYSNGDDITVYYAPENPGRAYLIPEYTFLPAYPAIVLGLFIVRQLFTPGSAWLRRVLRSISPRRFRDSISRSGTYPPDPDELDDADLDRLEESVEDEDEGDEDEPTTAEPVRDRPIDGLGLPGVEAIPTRLVDFGVIVAIAAVLGHYFVATDSPYSVFAYMLGAVLVVGVAYKLYHEVVASGSAA
ncbi:DUF3592 domain-containing protein [Haloarchaeobius sp. DFWS5]|uniref:DUF3592 domain-containing protein n=1 Tax=Haloarchaeobius sp. DFWS5 TaxID=3446114 RepID=UPI003EBDF4F3